MIDFRKVKFVISAPTYLMGPGEHKDEVVFLGKSNVGKSTLINSLVGQKIAFSSKKAGKTKLLNYFLVDDSFYLVDAPGYGYTEYGSKEDQSFSDMMEGYFQNKYLKAACLLVDARRGIKDDEKTMLKYLRDLNLPYIVVFTKADQCKQGELLALKKEAERRELPFVYFSKNGKDIGILRSQISDILTK